MSVSLREESMELPRESERMRGKPNNGFPQFAHYLKTARHFGALNVQVSTQSKILAL